MSRTTTVDGAPASDTDKQSISQSNQFIKRGTPQFMRVTLALFSAGLATFALLYCVQPILPVLSQEFGLTPANSSISLSISTAMLAIGLLFTGPLSDAITSDGHGATVGLHLYVTFDNDDQLARHFDYARLDWAFVKWRGSRWHDLS